MKKMLILSIAIIILCLSFLIVTKVKAEDKIITDEIGGELVVPEDIEVTITITEDKKEK